MPPSPPSKRQKTSALSTTASSFTANPRFVTNQAPTVNPTVDTSLPPASSSNPRKRRGSPSQRLDTLPPPVPPLTSPDGGTSVPVASLVAEESAKKRGRTNTPWTAAEEQRLKQMRDAGHNWGEIAKAFPHRTEGSVKKHWYKDMHYAEFGEDETVALREAIREYEANKWKVIGQKLGKPAKACEQFAREHFKNS